MGLLKRIAAVFFGAREREPRDRWRLLRRRGSLARIAATPLAAGHVGGGQAQRTCEVHRTDGWGQRLVGAFLF